MKKRKVWKLFEDGNFIDQFDSYEKAEKVKLIKDKEADDDWLDLYYEIKECEI